MCQGYIDRGQIAGISACIAHRGETVFRQNFGWANIEKGQPITDDTIYRIFSMTKPITALAALMLWEEEKFDLDDEVSKYLPAFAKPNYLTSDNQLKPCKNAITIRHLLTMTSGMGYDFQTTAQGVRYSRLLKRLDSKMSSINNIEFANQLATVPLVFEPGTDYNYAFSLEVIGALIEVISGQKFGVFLQQRILKPLGMIDTGFHVPESKQSRFCELYLWDDEELIPISEDVPFFSHDLPLQFGGGGLVSTVDDYMKFTRLMLNNGTVDGRQFVKPETLTMMRSNHLEGKALEHFYDDGNAGYGYGLGVRSLISPKLSGLNASVGEFGWDGAASTWTGIDQGHEVTAVFMLQLFPFCQFPATREFQELTYNAAVQLTENYKNSAGET